MPAPKRFISYEEAHKYLYIKDWKLYRKIATNRNNKAGTLADSLHSCGYSHLFVNGHHCLAHRVIWLMSKGYLPEGGLDHIDRDKQNNDIENLREVSHTCNSRNKCVSIRNTSGVTGVGWVKGSKKWAAHIMIKRKSKFLGYYKSFDDAVCARLAGEQCVEWSGCNSFSSAYQYVKRSVQNVERSRSEKAN